MKNITIATYGSIGIQVVRKMFSLGYIPDNITIITHNPASLENTGFISFLNYWHISWYMPKSDMKLLWSILITRKTDMLINIAYKYIYREPVLSMGIPLINMHPGMLPDYKGWLSVPWAIFNGEKYVGYTYHLIDDKIDHGDILSIDVVKVFDTSTAFDLHYQLHDMAISELGYILAKLYHNKPQLDEGTFYKRTFPNNGYIDETWDDKQIDRMIRAMYFPPHKGSLLKTNKGDVEITSFEQYLKIRNE